MNTIRNLMGKDVFTSSEFNRRLNKTIEHGGWNGRTTLNFLYVAESLGMVKCLGTGATNQYRWKITD